MDGKQQALLDTSVLINFAAIGRMDLFVSHPGFSFLATDHVRDEVKEHFSEQYDAVSAAVADGTITELKVDSPEELSIFATLVAIKSLGEGECSAIAVAIHRSIPLAIDDRRARKKALKFHPSIELFGTEDIVISLIQAGILTVDDADAIKLDWETNFRFRLPFSSFRELLA